MKTNFIIILCLFSLSLAAQSEQKMVDSISTKQDSVYAVAYRMPTYNGGEAAMYKWLSENIKYPNTAMKDSVSGLVIIHFIVEKDGSITNAEVLKGIGDGCDEEALRVVNLMPKWIPGELKGGKPIRVMFNIPIRYAL